MLLWQFIMVGLYCELILTKSEAVDAVNYFQCALFHLQVEWRRSDFYF